MTLAEELQDLRRRLDRLASQADVGLLERYALRYKPDQPLSAYRRSRIALGRLLRRWGIRRPPPPEPWLPRLRHVRYPSDVQPLVIWALGLDRDTLRTACGGIQTLQRSLPGLAPVLITNVADFAFFSRLGWLVEYVPKLSPPAERYADRKQRYLAWLYRDAAAVPASIGLAPDVQIDELTATLAAMSRWRGRRRWLRTSG